MECQWLNQRREELIPSCPSWVSIISTSCWYPKYTSPWKITFIYQSICCTKGNTRQSSAVLVRSETSPLDRKGIRTFQATVVKIADKAPQLKSSVRPQPDHSGRIGIPVVKREIGLRPARYVRRCSETIQTAKSAITSQCQDSHSDNHTKS